MADAGQEPALGKLGALCRLSCLLQSLVSPLVRLDLRTQQYGLPIRFVLRNLAAVARKQQPALPDRDTQQYEREADLDVDEIPARRRVGGEFEEDMPFLRDDKRQYCAQHHGQAKQIP